VLRTGIDQGCQPRGHLNAEVRPSAQIRHDAWNVSGPSTPPSCCSMSAFQRAFRRRPARRCTKLRHPTA